MEANEILKCIEKAKERRKVKKPLVIQSDYAEEKTIPKFWIRRMKIA